MGTPGALHDDYVDVLVQALMYLRGNLGPAHSPGLGVARAARSGRPRRVLIALWY